MNNNVLEPPTLSLVGIKFGVMSDKEIEKRSVAKLISSDMKIDQEGSVVSLDFGSNSDCYCYQCGETSEGNGCPGHSGLLKLNTYVVNTTLISTIVSYLKLFCHECGGLTLGENAKYNVKQMINTLNSSLKKGTKCRNIIDYTKDNEPIYCDKVHPHVFEPKKNKCIIVLEYYKLDTLKKKFTRVGKREMSPGEIFKVFSRIRPSALKFLKIPEGQYPINYINKLLYVPGNVIRADQTNSDDKKSRKNDINMHLISILRKNKESGDITDLGVDFSKYKTAINDITKSILELRTVPAANQQIKCVSQFLSSKRGIIRGSILGFRIFYVSRLFIGNETSARMDEIWIPDWLAKPLGMDEKMSDVNREFLMQFILNGKNKQPSCKSITKKNGKNYHLNAEKQVAIENGDIIHRDLINGDICAFNRAPTLKKSNIGGVKLKIVPGLKMIKFNVSCCAFYDADYDGDEMVTQFCKTNSSAFELESMAGIPQNIISNGRGIPALGQVQDAVIGLGLLTRDNVRLTRTQVIYLFSNIDIYPDIDGTLVFLPPRETKNKANILFTGHDVLSLLFNALNIKISYKSSPSYFEKKFIGYRRYNKTETEVVVKDGIFISGIIDNKAIGEQSYNGIYHKIYLKYGPQKTLDVIWYCQQIALLYLMVTGLTMSIGDYVIAKESIAEIKRVESASIAESIYCAQNLYQGKLVPPTGKTVREFYESEQLNILGGAQRFPELIHRGIDYEENNMYKCINFKSKGKSDNFDEIVVALGQSTINGKRLPGHIDGRVSQFYTRDSTEPQAHGYVSRSYSEGLHPADVASSAQPARNNLIEKALKTASSGSANRETIASLESAVLDNLRRLVYGNRIRQSLYGGCAMDPRMTYKSSLRSLGKNLKEFLVIKEEYEQMVRDRDLYIKWRINSEERTGYKYDEIGYIPMNYDIIIEEIKLMMGKSGKLLNHAAVYKKVKNFIDRLPLLYLNKEFANNLETGKIPESLKNSLLFFQMYLRFELCIKNIEKHGFSEKHVDMVLQKIESTFMRNLEDPGVCAGIRACQAILALATQQSLSAIHGGGENKIENFKNTYHARKTDKIPNLNMKIYFKPQFEGDKKIVQDFADNIEMTVLKDVLVKYQIFFESISNVIHPDFTAENKIIREKIKLISPPNNLLPWCLRFELSVEKLIAKHITTEMISNQLQVQFPNIYIVASPMNFVRVYLRQGFIGKTRLDSTDAMRKIAEMFTATIIRGVEGINTAFVKSRYINVFDGDEVKSKQVYYIFTEGSNLREIVMFKAVDQNRTYSNSMREIEEIIGITGARNAIMDSLQASVDGAHYIHYTVFADQMTCTPKITSLNRTGSTQRKASTMTLIADQNFMLHIRNAASTGKVDKVTGPNSALICGTVPKIGTAYNKLLINESFLGQQQKEKVKDLEDI